MQTQQSFVQTPNFIQPTMKNAQYYQELVPPQQTMFPRAMPQPLPISYQPNPQSAANNHITQPVPSYQSQSMQYNLRQFQPFQQSEHSGFWYQKRGYGQGRGFRPRYDNTRACYICGYTNYIVSDCRRKNLQSTNQRLKKKKLKKLATSSQSVTLQKNKYCIDAMKNVNNNKNEFVNTVERKTERNGKCQVNKKKEKCYNMR
jgi:hypothetical protein